jgi:hypothetical protein
LSVRFVERFSNPFEWLNRVGKIDQTASDRPHTLRLILPDEQS